MGEKYVVEVKLSKSDIKRISEMGYRSPEEFLNYVIEEAKRDLRSGVPEDPILTSLAAHYTTGVMKGTPTEIDKKVWESMLKAI